MDISALKVFKSNGKVYSKTSCLAGNIMGDGSKIFAAMKQPAVALVVCLLLCIANLSAGDIEGGANLLPGNFESGSTSYNPWAGVDDQGNIQVITGAQNAVDDSGSIGNNPFSPSVAVGDLNGDGLPDLLVADARGFFWYFPNSGKLNAPVFTHGEIIPVWLGGGEHEGDAVPRVQLLSFTGEKKLGIVAGNYLGGLYFIHNLGSATEPDFRMPDSRNELLISTHSANMLWCNYLSPFLYDWSQTGRLDLLMGDGSYSANSIFLFKNLGSNDRPKFNENNEEKIIPGMGREHLTPEVIDWNNDGKPDVICGEREGYINVYLNQATDKAAAPVFDRDHPIHATFGSVDKVGESPTVCPANLYHSNLFDVLVGTPDGHICCASNLGSLGNPTFGPLVPLKGTNQYQKIIAPKNWAIDRYRPDGAPYELLECTNASVEKGFVPPPDPFKGSGALKFSMVDPNNVYFKKYYQPTDSTRNIKYTSSIGLEAGIRYKLSMWVMSIGNISGLTWHLEGSQNLEGDNTNRTWYVYTGSEMAASGSWSKVETDVQVPRTVEDNPDQKKELGSFTIRLQFQGDGSLYLDDISLKKN